MGELTIESAARLSAYPKTSLGAGLPAPSKPATGLPRVGRCLRSIGWLGQETGHSRFSDGLLSSFVEYCLRMTGEMAA